MKEYKINLKLLLTVIALFSVSVVGIILIISEKYNCSDFINLIWNYGFVTIPLSLIWLYFEKCGWRHKLWKWSKKFMRFPPDIRGRWEGCLKRAGEDEIKFVIEIKQTMSNIQVNTFSENGHSESILDAIASDKMEDDFSLAYLWQGESGKLPIQEGDSGTFNGYTILRLITNENEKKSCWTLLYKQETNTNNGKYRC
jgi:hypothetical protein